MAGNSSGSKARTTTSGVKGESRSASRSIAGKSKRSTPVRSKRPSKGSSTERIDPKRPVAAAIWKQARELVHQYQLVLIQDPEVQGYVGRTVEMPLVMADGSTLAAAAEATLEATSLAVASMLEDGHQPPAPSSEGKRNRQVNVRLTAEEKFRLEEAARREGFRSLSDFLRSAAIGRAG